MDFLGPFHPLIVHTPIALIIFSFVFEVVGRAMDADWWRRAAVVMLVIGVLGGVAAILSGEPASEVAEKRQGVPEAAVERHEDIAKISVWLGGGALAARAIAAAMPAGAVPVAILAFVLHLASAVSIGVASYRGGQLVYTRGAGVRVDGELVRHGTAAGNAAEAAGQGAAGESTEAGQH